MKSAKARSPKRGRQLLAGFLIGSSVTAVTGLALILLSLPGWLKKAGSLDKSSFAKALELNGSKGLTSPAEDKASQTQFLPHPHHGFFEDPSVVGTTPLHMSPVCGNWQEQYIQLHHSIRAENVASGKERFLVFATCEKGQKCGGLGDQLVGITTSFMLALVFQRAFLIRWPGFDSEAFGPAAVDWRVTPELKLSPSIETPSTACGQDGAAWENGTSAEVDFLNLDSLRVDGTPCFECLQQLEAAGTVVLRANRGITYWAVENSGIWGQRVRQIGLRPPYAFGCLMRFLFRLLPEVGNLVAQHLEQLSAPNTFSICIHARPGKNDDMMYNKTVNVKGLMKASEPLLSCAKRLTEYWSTPSQHVVWFVMSSSKELRAAVKQRYKDRVLTTELVPLHVESSGKKEALQTTVAEWLLCSKCNLFTFHNSGLSKTAALFAMKPMSIFMFERVQNLKVQKKKRWRNVERAVAEGLSCDPSFPSDPRDLAYTWSGV